MPFLETQTCHCPPLEAHHGHGSSGSSVDCSIIALWLGHEHVETTQIYLEATLAMKEKALAKTPPPDGTPGRYKPGDRLLAFLNSL